MALRQQQKILQEYKKKQVVAQEWYSLRSLLGNDWAIFYVLLGGREIGKSYAVTKTFVRQYKRDFRPFYWLRLTEKSSRNLLQNNAEKLIDPDIRRHYNLDLHTSGTNVYEVLERDCKGRIKRKQLMCRVLAINMFYNDKGSGLFDNEFLNDPKMYYNICFDEMNREANEKNSFDIVYAFTNQIENLIRSTKKRVRIICIGNTLQEASDILSAFNFIPDNFGRYYLKSKRCIIDYIAPNDKYLSRREGSVADILMPEASTFTNIIDVDASLVTKQRLIRPTNVIQFDRSTKFTLWDGSVIKRYNHEKAAVIAMRRYGDEIYNQDLVNSVIARFDARAFKFTDLATQKMFSKQLSLIKK